MKKVSFFLFLFITTIITVQAQQQGKVRGGLDLGLAIPQSGGGGFTAGFELKYNVLDNWNLGTRLELAGTAKDIPNDQVSIGSSAGILIVSDYYFNRGNSSFAPFIGGGVGYYGLGGVEVARDDADKKIDSDLISTTNKIGGLARVGFEASRFRATFGYNYIPDATYTNKDNKQFTVENSHFSITLGFYIGGGKWKK